MVMDFLISIYLTILISISTAESSSEYLVLQEERLFLNTDNIPLDEIQQNIEAHRAEFSNQEEFYHSGPCNDCCSHFPTKGFKVPGNFILPDFNADFRKNNDDLIRVTRTPLLTKEECDKIIDLAETYFSEEHNGIWSKLPSGRFEISGSWIKDINPLRSLFNSLLKTKIFPMIAQLFPDISNDGGDLVIQSAYIFKYTPESGEKTDMHIDSSLLSFTILLNDPEDFEGGGTFFECLCESDSKNSSATSNIIQMPCGHVTFRPASLRHRGQPITKGTRYVIGGFVMNRKRCEHVRQFLNRGTQALVDGDTLKAQKLFNYAKLTNPKYSEVFMSLAHTKRKFDNALGALKDYQTAFDLNPKSADAAFMIGVMYGELNKDHKALEWLKKAIHLNEYDGEAYYRQGLIFGRFGNIAAEKAMYENAIRVQPNHADAHCNLGVCYGEAMMMQKEIDCYERALELEPGHKDALQNAKAVYYQKGVTAYQRGDLESARTAVERILNGIAPNEAIIRHLHDAIIQRQKEHTN